MPIYVITIQHRISILKLILSYPLQPRRIQDNSSIAPLHLELSEVNFASRDIHQVARQLDPLGVLEFLQAPERQSRPVLFTNDVLVSSA